MLGDFAESDKQNGIAVDHQPTYEPMEIAVDQPGELPPDQPLDLPVDESSFIPPAHQEVAPPDQVIPVDNTTEQQLESGINLSSIHLEEPPARNPRRRRKYMDIVTKISETVTKKLIADVKVHTVVSYNSFCFLTEEALFLEEKNSRYKCQNTHAEWSKTSINMTLSWRFSNFQTSTIIYKRFEISS